MRRRASWILAALVAVLSGCGPLHCKVVDLAVSRSTGKLEGRCENGDLVLTGDKVSERVRKCLETP